MRRDVIVGYAIRIIVPVRPGRSSVSPVDPAAARERARAIAARIQRHVGPDFEEARAFDLSELTQAICSVCGAPWQASGDACANAACASRGVVETGLKSAPPILGVSQKPEPKLSTPREPL